MEITDVTATTVSIPLLGLDEPLGISPYVTNHGVVKSVERVLVRVDTDAGISGWGEVRTFLSADATESVIEEGVAPFVVGQSPFEIERFRRQVFIKYTNAGMFLAPVETACWDIVGKHLEYTRYRFRSEGAFGTGSGRLITAEFLKDGEQTTE